jgi:pimeloyl-ACP methyl ester carboxylesterase
MPSVKINGKRLFYTIDGDPATKVTTLFIHGLGSSSCFYHSIIPGLKSSTCCIALDIPGSGQSELGKSEQSIATIAEDAVGLLDTLNIKEKVIVVGHSLGSIVANYFAATYPDRVRGVVLLGPVDPNPAIVPVFDQRIQVVKNGKSNLCHPFVWFP